VHGAWALCQPEQPFGVVSQDLPFGLCRDNLALLTILLQIFIVMNFLLQLSLRPYHSPEYAVKGVMTLIVAGSGSVSPKLVGATLCGCPVRRVCPYIDAALKSN
jgi:hypothetical protein